jgi:ABC-type nitrate/sulfonate/bicarbonate transport system permease component
MTKLLKYLNATTIGFILLPIVLIVLCYVVKSFAPSSLRFPSPLEIAYDIKMSWNNPLILSALGSTVRQVAFALILSTIAGILLGFLLGSNLKMWSLSQPTVDFFRSIPVTFLIPAVSLLIGSTSPNIIFWLATYPCMLIMLLHVRYGIARQDPELIHSFHLLSGTQSRVKRFVHITIYEVLPEIASGLRVSLSYCIVIVTVLEYMKLGNGKGIGGMINDELQNLNYTRVYSLIFWVGLLGFLLNKIIEFIQTKYIHWSLNNNS